MLVEKIMSEKVVTIPVTAGLGQAVSMMKEFDIRHLPVVEGDRLLGLVTEGDLRGAIFPAMIEDIGVKDLMISNPATVSPSAAIEDAARIFYRRKIGCLPVVDDAGNLKGIITTADMLAAFIEIMGFLTASSRLDVVLPDKPEALEEACRIIQKGGARIVRVSLTQLRGNRPVHLFRLDKTDLDPIVKDLTRAGHKVVSRLG
ncbi:MAG: CBS and ACT domain-containing protein [Thermodesulfobacteriota bacterium]|nr:CBS and ACT domain-containing protein [Thermodesulfobacteriota bacterium]